MTTREFPTSAVLTLASGRLVSSFDEMWEVADFMAGGPLMTHHFASQEVSEQLRDRLIAQASWLAGAIENMPDFDTVPRDRIETACKDWVAQVAAKVGPTITLAEPAELIRMSFWSGLEHLGGAQ